MLKLSAPALQEPIASLLVWSDLKVACFGCTAAASFGLRVPFSRGGCDISPGLEP